MEAMACLNHMHLLTGLFLDSLYPTRYIIYHTFLDYISFVHYIRNDDPNIAVISALGLLPNKVFVHWLWRVSYFKSNSYNIHSVWLALTWVIRDRDYIQRVKVNTFNNTFPILSILACYKKVRLCYWWEMLNMLKKTRTIILNTSS